MYFKIVLHHLKNNKSHVVGHCPFDLSEHANEPSDSKNIPFEKMITLTFQKCIDKNAKLYVYLHSMRVTDQDYMNFDLDDNLSGYY